MPRTSPVIPIAALCALCTLLPGASHAGEGGKIVTTEPAPTPTLTPAPGNLATDPAVLDMIQRLEKGESFRVMVMVDAGPRPERRGNEDDDALETRRNRAAQQAVINRVLGPDSPTPVDGMDFIPCFMFFPTADQLRRLAADPGVTSIREDRPEGLFTPPE